MLVCAARGPVSHLVFKAEYGKGEVLELHPVEDPIQIQRLCPPLLGTAQQRRHLAVEAQ